MDRLTRSLVVSVSGMGLLLTASGCKMSRPEVPPGRSYASDGRQRPAIGFSSEGHPVDGSAMTNLMPDTAGASKLSQGINSRGDRPNMSPLLEGGKGEFGPPGTSGRTDAGGSDGDADSGRTSPAGNQAVLPAGSPNLSSPSISPIARPATDSTSSLPTTLPPDAEPTAEPTAPASPAVLPAVESAGQMSRSNDFPSPN